MKAGLVSVCGCVSHLLLNICQGNRQQCNSKLCIHFATRFTKEIGKFFHVVFVVVGALQACCTIRKHTKVTG